MKALLRVMAQFHRQNLWLAIGLLISLSGTLVAVALSSAAGAVFAGIGLLAIPHLLRQLGPARVVLRYLERLTTHDALFRALADLRVWFFRGLALRMAGGLGMQRAGDLLARLVGDVQAQDVVYMRVLLPLFSAIVLLPVLFVLLIGISPLLAVIVALLFCVAGFALPSLSARFALAQGATLAQAMGNMRVSVLDSVVGLREIRAFAAEDRMMAQVQAREAQLFAAQRAASHQMAGAGAMAFLAAQAAILAVLVLARHHGAQAIGLVFAVIAGFEAIALLPRAGAQAGSAAAAAQRVLAVADGPILLPDPADPTPLPANAMLRFEGVHFRWNDERAALFDGLSLEVQPGQRVALLGPSGSGKSSLAALALRLAAPQAGRITLGGVDIADLAARDLRSRIGWLSQATHLFDDTIRANLLMARPDADDDALWAALEQAQISEAVRALPEQLDAYLGEAGHRFSGGQSRRLSLARALLSPAKILILDEPCAGLDIDTEREFLSTLNNVADQRSIVLIAHRLTGVERMDRIFRLSAGKAVAAAG